MPKVIRKLFTLIVLLVILIGCVPSSLPTDQASIPTALATPSPELNLTGEPEGLPVATEYNLGETTITQSMFTEDSRFYNMPVRLNGMIAVPSGDSESSPVVVIMHGNHPGCPVPEGDMVDRWPCDPELERPNYRGFEYLLRRLAAKGYLALSININAEYTFGFGEPVPVERLEQLVDLHLKALAEANGGGENNFGVELEGRADLKRVAFIGHSQGGEFAYWLTQEAGLDAPDAFNKLGYGPVYGLLMIAPSANWAGASGARLPMAIILPACDNDVINQEGQLYYEINRLDIQNLSWASSVWLERANHNYFNETLSDEAVERPARPDCTPLLQPETQREFLSKYAVDFLAEIFHLDPGVAQRLGTDLQIPAQDELYGLPARLAALAPGFDRLPLLLPADASELKTNLLGGSVTADNLTPIYCKQGHYVPAMKPGSEPCKRVNLVVPGNPAMIVASWQGDGGVLRFTLPEGSDFTQFSALSLRATIDPLSPLNKAGAYQAFSVQLIDQQGNADSVQTRADEPALRFPDGYQQENDTFDGGWFTGRVPLTSIRLSLRDFSGVNLAEIREIALLFDQNPSGTLFISDLELVR